VQAANCPTGVTTALNELREPTYLQLVTAISSEIAVRALPAACLGAYDRF
jgi:hypothetical protein